MLIDMKFADGSLGLCSIVRVEVTTTDIILLVGKYCTNFFGMSTIRST